MAKLAIRCDFSRQGHFTNLFAVEKVVETCSLHGFELSISSQPLAREFTFSTDLGSVSVDYHNIKICVDLISVDDCLKVIRLLKESGLDATRSGHSIGLIDRSISFWWGDEIKDIPSLISKAVALQQIVNKLST
jgi:hypothetical protein